MPAATGASPSRSPGRGERKRRFAGVSLLLPLLLGGCANTKASSYVAPGVTHVYQKTMVFARTDPSMQRKIEDRVVQGLTRAGIEAYSSARTLPAEHNPDLEEAKFAELGIDTVLILQVDSMKVVEKEVMAASTTTQKRKDGTTVTTQNPAVKSQITEGTFTATLRDAKTQGEVWVNSGRSEGVWLASVDTVRDSFIDNAVADLVTSGVLAVHKTAPPQ
jgi:hypothetical protein